MKQLKIIGIVKTKFSYCEKSFCIHSKMVKNNSWDSDSSDEDTCSSTSSHDSSTVESTPSLTLTEVTLNQCLNKVNECLMKIQHETENLSNILYSDIMNSSDDKMTGIGNLNQRTIILEKLKTLKSQLHTIEKEIEIAIADDN